MVVLAGITGNLGGRIAAALVAQKIAVRGLIRRGASPEKLRPFRELGIEVRELDFDSIENLAKACEGAECVVSVLSGLRSVIMYSGLAESSKLDNNRYYSAAWTTARDVIQASGKIQRQ